jgi:hypothetical protein
MSEINIIHTTTQDGPQVFKVVACGYYAANNKLSISIEGDNLDEEGFPENLSFCLENHPFSGEFHVGDVFECNGGGGFNIPGQTSSWGYHGEHAEKTNIKLVVLTVKDSEILFSLHVIHDDMNYFGKKAKDCISSAIILALPVPLNQIWNPG